MTVTDPRALKLRGVHSPTACAGRPCPMHAPTRHHMRAWPVHWRSDRGIIERLCEHGCGHPDPDQYPYWRATGQEYLAVHGCDGCCEPPGPLIVRASAALQRAIRWVRLPR